MASGNSVRICSKSSFALPASPASFVMHGEQEAGEGAGLDAVEVEAVAVVVDGGLEELDAVLALGHLPEVQDGAAGAVEVGEPLDHLL